MSTANMSTEEHWVRTPTVDVDLDGFNHQLAVSVARRRLFGDGPLLRIGRYRVESRIGAGGMGEVYLAVDEELDRKLAIKRVLPGLIKEHHHARLRDEARALAKLSHDNVVQVYEIGEHERRTFLAMQYVEGQSLASWLAEQPRSWPEILARFCAAGRGLAAAHEAGVVHRDFKPDNVLLGVDGSVRVADFGLALTRPEVGADVTTLAQEDIQDCAVTNYVAGTFRYMALEQLCGERPDARSDQFSFCVALYEALWTEQPFELGSLSERLEVLLQGRPHPPARSNVPAGLWRVVRRGLARSPRERWPDMAGLLDALEAVPRRRRRAIRAAVAVPLLAGLAVAGVLALPERSPEPELVLVPAPAPAEEAPVVEQLGIELARGPGRARPKPGPRIWIATDELRFADVDAGPSRHVVDLVDGRIPADAVERHIVIPLGEQLDGRAAEPRRPNVHDPITLFVDRRVPWTTIVDVLYSTGRAGYMGWDFAVETEGETRVLSTHPQTYAVPELQLAQLAMLQLWVASDHVEVSTQIDRPMDTQPGTSHALDTGGGDCRLSRETLDALEQLSVRLCELNGVAVPVWVGAEDRRSWAEVVEVLGHALHEGACDGGIIISAQTRPDDCAAPLHPDDLATLLESSM